MSNQQRTGWRLALPCALALLLAAGSAAAPPASCAPIAVPPPAAAGAAVTPAKGIVLFIGDGLGIATITAARIYKGQRSGVWPPEAAALECDAFPATAFVRTYSADAQVTDSSAAMTAMMTGEKTANGMVSVRAVRGADSTLVPGAPLRTFLELAVARGWATGIVTTTRVTHATPAACYAHVDHRGSEWDIALALLENPALAAGIEVVLGGGHRYFLPERDRAGAPVVDVDGAPGARRDGRDLTRELAARGWHVVQDAAGLAAVDPARTPRLLGLFASSHLALEMDRPAARPREPSLPAMTEKAIAILARDPDGFFLMVEGGRIDHALHGSEARRALVETLAFDAAIAAVLARVDPASTLVLVTGDHDHTLSIAGGGPLGSDILGLAAGVDADSVPFPTLLFGTGPGRTAGPRVAPTPAELADPDYAYPSAVRMGGGAHGGTDLPLYAWGASAPALVHGVIENTGIFTIMCRAAGFIP